MKKNALSFSLHLPKRFFITLLVVFAIIFVWRGIWNLLDQYFLPDQPFVSNVLSILVGLLLLYLPDQDIKELV